MIELVRIWWPGAKIAFAIFALSLVWAGLSWCFNALLGWLPETIYQILGWTVTILFYPIGLSVAVDAVLKKKKL